jgi:peptidyl-prolyl cis-trans isomerase-like 4
VNPRILQGPDKRFFKDEIQPDFKIRKKGLIGTANNGPNMNTSDVSDWLKKFFITLTDEHLQALNGKHTIFGIVVEGLDVLDKLSRIYVDQNNRPLVNIRIFHTLILEDPFEDLEGMRVPDRSPEPKVNV